MLAFPYAPGFAVQIARPLSEVDHSLSRIRKLLILITAGGVAIAAALGLAVARAALAPVRRLTSATENVTETGDLSERIDVRGRDELSRLAGSFNSMLGALEDSTRSQRQLVADASHELRTPLTSLRTNIEVLAGGRQLPDGERKRLLHDVVEQLGEMTTLIAELIELARGEQQVAEPEEVRLDLVAADRRGAGTPQPTAVTFVTTSTSRSSTAFPRRSSARSRTCSTTRRSGARRTARSTLPSATVRSRSATTAPASTRRTCRTSSTASTAPSRRGACRAQASALRSSGRWRWPTAAAWWPSAPTAAERAS